MLIPGVHVETAYNPAWYTSEQLDFACAFAYRLGRGRLMLLEPPRRRPPEDG